MAVNYILASFNRFKLFFAVRCYAIAVMRCPSVCPSVTFVSCAKTNKDIFEIFSPSGSQAILVHLCHTGWRYSDGNLLNGSIQCRWGRQKRDSERISLHTLHTGLQCCKPYESRSVKNTAATDGVEPSTHDGVDADYRQTRSVVRPLCDS